MNYETHQTIMNNYDADREQAIVEKYCLEISTFLERPSRNYGQGLAEQLRRFVGYAARVWFYHNETFPGPEYERLDGVLVGKVGSASAFLIECLDAAGCTYPKGRVDEFHRDVHEGILRLLQAEIDYPGIEAQLDRKSRGPFIMDPW